MLILSVFSIIRSLNRVLLGFVLGIGFDEGVVCRCGLSGVF